MKSRGGWRDPAAFPACGSATMNGRKWATIVVAAITAAERSIAASMLVTAGRIRTIVARRATTV
jgi:hypothetical protein